MMENIIRRTIKDEVERYLSPSLTQKREEVKHEWKISLTKFVEVTMYMKIKCERFLKSEKGFAL